MSTPGHRCPGCGLLGEEPSGRDAPVASPTCRRLIEVVGVREFSAPTWFVVHRLTVAAYSLQHPAEHSDRSVAAHLTVLHHAHTAPRARRARSAGVAARFRQVPAPHLEPPADRGGLTVADVVPATTAEEHSRRVRAWAASVWRAWAAHHDAPFLPG